uniref:Uncharacterized protein n=1 Tax=Magallana gigas TaxID=29159 RepID=K1Q4F9_MAGGI
MVLEVARCCYHKVRWIQDTSFRSTDSEFPDCSNQTAHLDSDFPVHVNPKFNQFSPNLAGNYCDIRHGKLSVQKVKEEMDLAKFKPDPERPRIFMSKNGKVVIILVNACAYLRCTALWVCVSPDGGFQVYLANPPDRAKDDSSVGAKNGQLSRAGSLTVLRRTNSKSKLASSSSSRTSSIAESDSYASVDLGTDKLPPIDTPEASHVCSIR